MSSEQYKRLEIIHTGNFDVLVNTNTQHPEMVAELLPQVQNGIPESWVQFSPYRLLEDMDDPTHISIDNNDSPRYFAKKRKYLDRRLDARQYPVGDEHRSMGNALSSLLNEFSIAPHIHKLLASEDAATLARRYTFARMKLVDPLIGIINRINREKIMFYPYVEGDSALGVSSEEIDRIDIIEQMSDRNFAIDLHQLFEKNGVKARDTEHHNLIAPRYDSPDYGILYIVDIEGCSKL